MADNIVGQLRLWAMLSLTISRAAFNPSIILIIAAISCGNNIVQKNSNPKNEVRQKSEVIIHQYDAMSITDFFHQLALNHQQNFSGQFQLEYQNVADSLHVNVGDTMLYQTYFEILVIHKIFTSTGAFNCARGEIISAPYMWHWCDPNPRHDIVQISSNKKLRDCKPPEGFGKYASYADIDRTPFIFLSEMLSLEPLYSHPDCGTFRTFGWCSEREMAFSCLMETLGYSSKVVVDGNHSWSEIKLKSFDNKKNSPLIVRVDNTFDQLEWIQEKSEVLQWDEAIIHKTAKWYNDKAHAVTEMTALTNHMLKPAAMDIMEKALNDFFAE